MPSMAFDSGAAAPNRTADAMANGTPGLSRGVVFPDDISTCVEPRGPFLGRLMNVAPSIGPRSRAAGRSRRHPMPDG